MLKYFKHIGILLLLCTAGIILLNHLNRPIWFDEAWSIMAYSPLTWSEIYTSYTAPNNHILFNMLLHSYLQLVGGFFPVSEVLFRIPIAFTSLTTIFLMYFFWKKRIGTKITFIIILSFILSPIFVIYGTAVRGYMLSILFVLCALESILKYSTTKKQRYIATYFLSSLLAVAVIPSNLFALVLLLLFPLMKSKNKKQLIKLIFKSVPIILCPFIAFILWYGPIWRSLYTALKHNNGWLHPFSACIHLYSGFTLSLLPISILSLISFLILLKRSQHKPATPNSFNQEQANNIIINKPHKHSTITNLINPTSIGITIIFIAPAIVILWHIPAPFPRVFLQIWPIWLYLFGIALKHLFGIIRKNKKYNTEYFFYSLVAIVILWGIGINKFTPELSKTFTRKFSQDDLFQPYFMKKTFNPLNTVNKLVKLTNKQSGQVFLSQNSDFPSIIFYGKLLGIHQSFWLTEIPGKSKINWHSINSPHFILVRNKEDMNIIEKRFEIKKFHPIDFSETQNIYLVISDW